MVEDNQGFESLPKRDFSLSIESRRDRIRCGTDKKEIA
jgi:hypothetical protein